jgi:hypothetical protein
MTFQLIFWTILAIVMLVGVPIALVWSIFDSRRSHGSERRGGGTFTAGIGAALQELDRLTARPSVEHKVETEKPILKREDDSGGDPRK